MRRLNTIINQADKIAGKILNKFEEEKVPFDIKDAVVIGLLEEMIGKSKSIKVLIENKQYDGLDAITRSILESYTYLKFILSEDTDRRAKAYFYYGKKDENSYYDQLLSKNQKGRRIQKYLNLDTKKIEEKLERDFYDDYKLRVLNRYIEVTGHEDMKRKWFNLDGKTNSIEILCNKNGLEVEYAVIYRMLSKDVHASRAYSRLKLEEDQVSVLLANPDNTLNKGLATTFLINSVDMILNYYKMKKDLIVFKTNLKHTFTL